MADRTPATPGRLVSAVRALATTVRRAGSAAVTAVVVVATGGQPPEGSVPAHQTTPEGGN